MKGNRKPREFIKINPIKCKELYELGWSDRKIALFFGCCHTSIRKWRTYRNLLVKNPNQRKVLDFKRAKERFNKLSREANRNYHNKNKDKIKIIRAIWEKKNRNYRKNVHCSNCNNLCWEGSLLCQKCYILKLKGNLK